MNINKQSFLSRFVINTILLFVVVALYVPEYLATFHGVWDALIGFLIVGLFFSIINAIVKPILTLLTLPAVVLSLGLFTLVINGVVIWLTAVIVPNLSMGLGTAILAGIVMSLANFLITNLFEERK